MYKRQILAYLPSGNPLTLESMLYGLASAALLSATLLWFTCYNAVMTSDKFIYLFGRVIPALSLVLSMTMRFVPRFRTQLHTVAQAQKYMGRDTENGKMCIRDSPTADPPAPAERRSRRPPAAPASPADGR